MNVTYEDMKAVIDIATGSLDFSSGFLDHEEVKTLRRVAFALGMDPMEATPREWRRQYAHMFRRMDDNPYWTPARRERYQLAPRCYWCDAGEGDPIHHGVDALSRLATDPAAE